MENLHINSLIIEPEGTKNLVTELCIVGRFLMEQQANFRIVRSRIASTWKPNRGVSIREIGGGRMMFQFYHKLDVKRVLEGAPWSFGNGPLILHQLRSGGVPLSVPLNKINFWLQIYDLPMGFFTEKVGTMLGNFIWQFLEYDGTIKEEVWKPFIRIKVEVDVSLPLKRKKKIKIGASDSAMVSFKYEKLRLFCFICGKIDHTKSRCGKLFDSV